MMHHHLLFCPNCRRFMRQMRLLQATLRELPEPPVPGLDELAARLAAEQKNTIK